MADMAAPPEADWVLGAAAAEVAPAQIAAAMSADAPTQRAMRMEARFDNYNPFSFLRLRG
ncbi:MAG: hypothetical protein JO120_06100 [Solirubrobacterales bacterium]|nr:hypothetical protein [Solirubrobacterales bacterium]